MPAYEPAKPKCSVGDFRCQENLFQNTQQHELLVSLLTQWGYNVLMRPMPLGYAGTIYKSNLIALMDLGLTRLQGRDTLRKLHVHAIKRLHNIITQRRYLERQGVYGQRAWVEEAGILGGKRGRA